MLPRGGVLKGFILHIYNDIIKKYRINALAIILHLDNLFVHIETARSRGHKLKKKINNSSFMFSKFPKSLWFQKFKSLTPLELWRYF